MITIYTAPSCSSCRKVKAWFKEQNIPFVEKNIFTSALKKEELLSILEKCENGTSDIIATKSKIIKQNKVNIDDMTISELIEFIKKNPSVLKRPIVVDDRKIQVGYNSDEITVFIPLARSLASKICSSKNCNKFDSCPSKNENN